MPTGLADVVETVWSSATTQEIDHGSDYFFRSGKVG